MIARTRGSVITTKLYYNGRQVVVGQATPMDHEINVVTAEAMAMLKRLKFVKGIEVILSGESTR